MMSGALAPYVREQDAVICLMNGEELCDWGDNGFPEFRSPDLEWKMNIEEILFRINILPNPVVVFPHPFGAFSY